MISTLLIANRGEIARRVIRTARSMGLRTVAVYSEVDENAPYVREADVAYALLGLTSAETYLDQQAIINAAQMAGADAVHPGYGFLAENADFAARCRDAGIHLVGPSPEIIATMASKVRAKKLMSDAGIPVLPQVLVGDDTPEIRFAPPYLIKASAGGGGKGMRPVFELSELEMALGSARREAASSFGDSTLFIEPLLIAPRHVEVQIVGDTHGNLLHLFDRECSIQRRHQKIIEEAPAPFLAEELRGKILEAAVVAGRTIGYSSAGTVEFLVEGDSYFFLEMNTRIQVEHPVTELVTGFDIVHLQLRAAAGDHLPFSQEDVRVTGHSIEARVYAEDPAHDYLPSTGAIVTYLEPELPGLRCDSGVETGAVVPHLYDSLLVKVIAHGSDRAAARALLARALDELVVHGVTTNRDSLVNILKHDAFGSGSTTTGFISEHPEVLDPPGLPPEVADAHLIAASLARATNNRDCLGGLATLPQGWRNVRSSRQLVRFRTGDEEVTVAYDFADPPKFEAAINGREVQGRAVMRGGTVDVAMDRLTHHCSVRRTDGTFFIDSIGAHSTFAELPRFRDNAATAAGGGVMTPVPGTVVAIHVKSGDRISSGQPIMTIEAMKMEHQLNAPSDGIVKEVLVGLGQSVEAHQVLVALEDRSK